MNTQQNTPSPDITYYSEAPAYVPIVESDYPNLVWTPAGSERLVAVNAAQATAPFPLREQLRRQLHEQLTYLNGYGGPVNPGHYTEIPKYNPKYDGPTWPNEGWEDGYYRSIVRAIREQNRAPKDLRPSYKVHIGKDSHPLSFSLTWHRLLLRTGEYVPSFYGGLICHASNADPFCVSLSSDLWGIHT